MDNTSPVMFAPSGGINQTVQDANNGFDSPGGESKPTPVNYTIPPVAWVFILLIGGYMGVRWIMED